MALVNFGHFTTMHLDRCQVGGLDLLFDPGVTRQLLDRLRPSVTLALQGKDLGVIRAALAASTSLGVHPISQIDGRRLIRS